MDDRARETEMFRRSALRLLLVYPLSGVVGCLLFVAVFVAVLAVGSPASTGRAEIGPVDAVGVCSLLALAFFVPAWGGVASVTGRLYGGACERRRGDFAVAVRRGDGGGVARNLRAVWV
jgi:hypothetical protein